MKQRFPQQEEDVTLLPRGALHSEAPVVSAPSVIFSFSTNRPTRRRKRNRHDRFVPPWESLNPDGPGSTPIPFDEAMEVNADEEQEIRDLEQQLERGNGNKRRKKDPSFYEGLVNRQDFEDRFGPPQDYCFGCSYGLADNTANLELEDVNRIISFIRNNIAFLEAEQLAVQVHRMYHKMQTKVNSELMFGEEPLPDWSPSTILAHLEDHICNPSLWVRKKIKENESIQSKILKETLIQYDPQTQQRWVDDKQFRVYNELTKSTLSLFKFKPKDAIFFDNDTLLDPRVSSQVIATHNKQLHTCLRERAKRGF